MCNSCKAANKNEYYDRANDLYRQVLTSPNKTDLIDKLIADANSVDPWSRSYAVVFLGLLGKEKVLNDTQQARIIEILRKSVNDKEPSIIREAVNAIRDIGDKAVIMALP
jgi:HEAT repeat protein